MTTVQFFGIPLIFICHVAAILAFGNWKYSFKKVLFIWGMSIVICFLIPFVFINMMRLKMGMFIAYWMTMILHGVIYMLMTSDKFGKALFMFILYTEFFLFTFTLSTYWSNGNDWIRHILRTIMYIIAIVIYRCFVKKYVDKAAENIKNGWISINIVAVLFLVLFTGQIIYPHTVFYHTNIDILRLTFIFTLTFGIYTLIFKNITYMDRLYRAEAKVMHTKFLESRVESLCDIEEEMRRVRHDIRHHNLTIAEYAKNNDLEGILKYLEIYEEEAEKNSLKVICENKTANNVLSAYYKKACREGIDISISAGLPEKTTFSDTDIVVILANILENAINGCIDSKEADAFIDFKMYFKSGKLVIQSRNTCAESIYFSDGLPTRKDVGGMGVRSIIHAAKHYDGETDFFSEGKIFTCRILLNL